MVSRRRFSKEFKFDAVSMVVDQGRDVYEVSSELDIRPDMLRKWKRKFEADGQQAFPVGQPATDRGSVLRTTKTRPRRYGSANPDRSAHR